MSATTTQTPVIDVNAILSAITGAVNAIVQSLSQYLPVIATLAAGVAVAYITLRFGRRLINRLFGLFGAVF